MIGFDVLTSRLIVTGQLETQTALRIGAGNSTDVTGSDNPVMKDSTGSPIIPGSSLKGALRAYLEAVLQTLKQHQHTEEKLVCNILSSGISDPEESCLAHLKDELSPNTRKIRKSELDERVVTDSCLMCRLFGSPWLGARLFLRDLPVYEGKNGKVWSGHYVFRDGVAIDRDTGTAADKRKYDFEAVPAGTRFDFKMQVDSANDMEMAIALLAIRTLEQGQIQLGGARSRGTGWCHLVEIDYRLYTNPLDLLLGKLSSPLSDADIEAQIKIFTDAIGQSHA
jgi:CRISPR-associated RAMP protein (TIGR02581 family)